MCLDYSDADLQANARPALADRVRAEHWRFDVLLMLTGASILALLFMSIASIIALILSPLIFLALVVCWLVDHCRNR